LRRLVAITVFLGVFFMAVSRALSSTTHHFSLPSNDGISFRIRKFLIKGDNLVLIAGSANKCYLWINPTCLYIG
jgi:hypothetical protein